MAQPKKSPDPDRTDANAIPPKERVRDRIMRTAAVLFYQRGIRAVGVDTIAEEAGTNKMSFYRSFASKDELVAEYLREKAKEAWSWWDTTAAAQAGNPRAQVETLFDLLVANTSTDDSRGCALANAAVEITEAGHPARPVVEKYKADVRQRFRALAGDMKAGDPGALGDALTLLWEGSCIARLTLGRDGPVQGAADAARALISAYTG